MVNEGLKIWFSKRYDKYFCQQNVICDLCNEPINKLMFLLTQYSKRYKNVQTICLACLYRTKNTGVLNELRKVILHKKIPRDSTLVLIKPHPLKDSKNNMTVFEVADRQIGNETIINKTRYANKESFKDIKIGKDIKEVIGTQDTKLQLDQVFNSLDNLQHQNKKAVEYERKKLLERV